MKNMGIDSHIEDAAKAIHKAKMIKDTPKDSLTKKSLAKKILAKEQVIHPEDIEELSKIMQKVIVSTDKAMKGAKVAKNKTKSKWIEVKKETAEIINHTRNAKYAAMASKKSANAALATAKKMKTPKLEKKYKMTYDVQIEASIRTAKVAKKETQKATKASKTARIALKEMQI